MIGSLLSRLIIMCCGTLYPAYLSYKAVRNQRSGEYVEWLTYWIVFGLFTFFEKFTDFFIYWLPLYYEMKVVIVIWLLSPITKGSSILFQNIVNPTLEIHESVIDGYLSRTPGLGYSVAFRLANKALFYTTNLIVQTAIKTYQFASIQAQSAPKIRNSPAALEFGETSPDVSDQQLLPSSAPIDTYADLMDYPMEGLIINEVEDDGDDDAARTSKTSKNAGTSIEVATGTKRRNSGNSAKLKQDIDGVANAKRKMRESTPTQDPKVDGNED